METKIIYNKRLGMLLVSLILLISLTIITVFVANQIKFNKEASDYIISIEKLERIRKGNLTEEETEEFESFEYITILFLQSHNSSKTAFNELKKIDDEKFTFRVIDFRGMDEVEITRKGIVFPLHYLNLVRENERFIPLFNAYTLKGGMKIYEDIRYVDRYGIPTSPFPEVLNVKEETNSQNINFSYISVANDVEDDENSIIEIELLVYSSSSSYTLDTNKFTLTDYDTEEVINIDGDSEYIVLSGGGTSYAKTFILQFKVKRTMLTGMLRYTMGDNTLEMKIRIPYLEYKEIPNKEPDYNVSYYIDEVLYETERVRKNEKTSIEDPVVANKIFMGWYTDKELSQKFDFETPITENISLYARFEDAITVKLISTEDETDTSEIKIPVGSIFYYYMMETESGITEDDLNKIEFYLDSEQTIVFDIKTEIITENITLYVKINE